MSGVCQVGYESIVEENLEDLRSEVPFGEVELQSIEISTGSVAKVA
ncbi:MAG: hypothetical protein ABEJ93_01320 [Candidatus Nanohalobium sp.]